MPDIDAAQWAFLGSLVTALLALVGTFVVRKGNYQITKAEAHKSPYEVLSSRVADMDDQLHASEKAYAEMLSKSMCMRSDILLLVTDGEQLRLMLAHEVPWPELESYDIDTKQFKV